jgi:hypothetical protein
MISYARNLEDVLLWRCFANVPQGFYVDLGALDPTVGSVTQAFYDAGWSGLNIAPEIAVGMFRAKRSRDINLGVAVAVDQIDSNRVTTLTQACREPLSGRHIHFFRVAADWAETTIMGEVDWSRCRPEIIVIERGEARTAKPAEVSWQGLLTDAGYDLAHFDGINDFWVRSESRRLVGCFGVQENHLDGVRRNEPRLDQLIQDFAAAAAAQDDLTRRLAEIASERDELSRQLIECVAEREDALKRLAFSRIPLGHLIQSLRVPRFVLLLMRQVRRIYRAAGSLVGFKKRTRHRAHAPEAGTPTGDKLMTTREVEEALATVALRSRSPSQT